MTYTRSVHLSDGDLFGAFAGLENGQTKQPHGRDDDGNTGENGEQASQFLLPLVELVKHICNKRIIKSRSAYNRTIGRFNVAQQLSVGFARNLNQHITGHARIIDQHHRSDLMPERVVVKIPDDPNYFVPCPHLAYGILHSKFLSGLFIDQHHILILFTECRQWLALNNLYPHGSCEIAVYIQGIDAHRFSWFIRQREIHAQGIVGWKYPHAPSNQLYLWMIKQLILQDGKITPGIGPVAQRKGDDRLRIETKIAFVS